MIELIAGRYKILEAIGRGGMGIVFRAEDTLSGETVAIKQLDEDLADEKLIERFKREGEALRQLNHPNIVKMLDAVTIHDKHYLIMEYVPGGDLSAMTKTGQMPLNTLLNVAIDLADALTRAHRLHIIHRDLKPANVLLADDGTVKLTDFGIARIHGKERVTDGNIIVGTIDYLSPEIIAGQTVDERSDIRAFGVMLVEMLSGKNPFTRDNAARTINAIINEPLPDLETYAPDAPSALIDLIYRMLERDVEARIPSVRIVGAELEAILHGREQVQQARFKTPVPDFAQRLRHNLPAQLTPFVGREDELANLQKLLQDDTQRFITILAPGGMGKTRLAQETGRRLLQEFEDGVYFVELSALSNATDVPDAIAEAAGFQFMGDGKPEEQLVNILGKRKLLLILDNFEHLPAGWGLVTDIVSKTSAVKVLVTSRQPLQQAGEMLFQLSGMDLPAWKSVEDAQQSGAARLFLNNAKRIKPDFQLTDNNLTDVIRICKQVQGMPLAIILASGWLTMLSVKEIANEIVTDTGILESDSPAIPERQRNIHTVMEYSWQQMSADEQTVLMQLSVFRGGFTREASTAFQGANLRVLRSLVNKSFLYRNADNGRYTIHELLRQYAENKFRASGLKDASLVHMRYYANFLKERTADMKGRRQLEGINEIETDFENIRTAWLLAVEQLDYGIVEDMMEGLALYCHNRNVPLKGIEMFGSALESMRVAENLPEYAVWNRLRIWHAYVRLILETPESTLRVIDDLKASARYARDNSDKRTIIICDWFNW